MDTGITEQLATDDEVTRVVEAGEFEPRLHFYERVLNAQMHPLVRFFMLLGNERIAERYCHMHPEANHDAVTALLRERPRFFRWGGADLFLTSSEQGQRRVVVIETNSCPSGQKSMPMISEADEQAGYRLLMERTFTEMLKRRALPPGELAVIYDKNYMEASGYAAAMADATQERVHLVRFSTKDVGVTAKFEDGVLEVRKGEAWVPIRAALRYVTQKPWNRIPPLTKTAILNPTLVCLAGGRNKAIAAKAYDLLNASLSRGGLQINAPETIWDVSLVEVPLWIQRLGGVAVVKNPYSNAGQGVHTITNREELDAFLELDHEYDRFIVQALIGNSKWSSHGAHGPLYHVGTVPNKKGHIYVADVRCMVVASEEGFSPVALYARRARSPLESTLRPGESSWDMLGTNLSVKTDKGWDTQTERLLLMDSRDFNLLGLGLDDLIEAYLQTVMSVKAIDAMAAQLITTQRKFRRRLFRSLNPDPKLVDEVCM
jgi:hypothetical protein